MCSVCEYSFSCVFVEYPLHCVNINHCDSFNKEADGPIAEQDKVRQESQTENAGKKKGRVRSHQKMQREARWACHTEKR